MPSQRHIYQQAQPRIDDMMMHADVKCHIQLSPQ